MARLHRHYQSTEFDMGGGFYIEREQFGRSVWWAAVQLDAPGGYVVKGRAVRQLGYRRDAEKKIREWKAIDGTVQ